MLFLALSTAPPARQNCPADCLFLACGRREANTVHPPQTNKKISNKKLDSQISYFSRKSKDLIIKSNKNSLLEDRNSRLSLEKSYFLLDRGGVIVIMTVEIMIIHPPRSNKKELFSNESLDFLSLSRLFSLDFIIRSLLFLLK